MNAIVILILAALGIGIGYGVYARWVDRRVIEPDFRKVTPAKMYKDDVDFIPSHRGVLFGYQFQSIAALSPITGSIVVALRWGWLPALLWIVLGTFFIGWVQDYATSVMTMREGGKTLGGLGHTLISSRARTILLVFIYCYLWLGMGAFGKIVGYDLFTNPRVPFGTLTVIVLGILAGQMIYKWKMNIVPTTVIAVVVSLVGIWVGTRDPVAHIFAGLNSALGEIGAHYFWSTITLLICYFGAVLPIWRWAQPINFVSFWIIALGMLGAVLGVLIWHPALPVDFPAFTDWNGQIGGRVLRWPLWPFLPITLAGGAISGWHGLVSNFSTARQIERETDALPVSGGAMFLEAFLAIIALLAGVAGVGATGGLGFAKYMELLATGETGSVFTAGLAQLLSHIAVPTDLGAAYGSVFLTVMALTTMQLMMRFMRMVGAEMLGDSVAVTKNVHVGSSVALILSATLIWTGLWTRVWVLFGSSNQLLASLALLLATVWLIRERKPSAWILVPFVFLYLTAIVALILTIGRSLTLIAGATVDAIIGNTVTAGLSVTLVICALILGYDGVRAIQRYRATSRPPQSE
nr:carbon starvation protein A [Anaerolineae bacterium]